MGKHRITLAILAIAVALSALLAASWADGWKWEDQGVQANAASWADRASWAEG